MGVVGVVEKGNTRWKVALFEDGEIVSVSAGIELDFSAFKGRSISKIMLTGSGAWNEEVEGELQKISGGNLHIYRYGDENPLKTEVKDAGSLGTDRVANSFAVVSGVDEFMAERKAWLVVDVGTCVTCDLVVDGVHKGGSISPGVEMRLISMHEGTAALPLVEAIDERGPGLSTKSALIEGALGGIEAEITGRWQILREQHPDLGIILTGGGSYDLELGSVQPKFADSNLTLKGYYALLQ